MKKNLLLTVCLLLLTVVASAQTPGYKFHRGDFQDGAIYYTVSDNGKWAIAKSGGSSYNDATPKLLEVATGKVTDLVTEDYADNKIDLWDVSDDGEIAVGTIAGMPAFHKTHPAPEDDGQEWFVLDLDLGWATGCALAVTPDGKYAVGYQNGFSGKHEDTDAPGDFAYDYTTALWNLETGELIPTPGTPEYDMTHRNQYQSRFLAISADGKKILGEMSWSYVQPISVCTYVYNVETQTYKIIGYTEDILDAWTPDVDNFLFMEMPSMSPNGLWVTGSAYAQRGNDTYSTPCRFNTETNKFELLDSQEDNGYLGMAIDNDGHIFAGTQTDGPLRNLAVLYNGLWISFEQITKQALKTDFRKETGLVLTGSPTSVSSDGRVIAAFEDPQGGSYCVNLGVDIASACKDIDMLADYTVTPEDGSVMAQIKSLTLNFAYNVEVIGSLSDITVKSKDGSFSRNPLTSSNIDGKKLTINFRTYTTTDGMEYIVNIPAGTLALVADKSYINNDINIKYVGRANKPIAIVSASPADGSEVSAIDNQANPIVVTFDSPVTLNNSVQANIYRIGDGEDVLVSSLTKAYQENRIAFYPSAPVYLMDGMTYQIRVDEGLVTDVNGGCASEAFSITYKGTYMNSQGDNNRILFQDDFSSMANSLAVWLRYEGDHLTPRQSMVAYEFDADNQPWNFSVRDEDDVDYCAASHSLYSPSGKSDDWMSTPQINLVDDRSTLEFDAQGYSLSAKDTLTVMVYATDEQFANLSTDIVNKFKANGKVIFKDIVSPGENESKLAGDWSHYTISLAEFAGKKIYIAFINQNNNQSMVFVDNVKVERDIYFEISLSTEQYHVAEESTDIRGALTLTSDDYKFNSISLTLKDANGNDIDTVGSDNITLGKDSVYRFDFNKPLPLVAGKANKYTIDITLDDRHDEMSGYIYNLAFKTTKRVIMEENTGRDCVNCPSGLQTIEYLKGLYGEQYIPISIHCYPGDPLGDGLTGYAEFLGLTGAPQARFNRDPGIVLPFVQDMKEGSDTYAQYFFTLNTHETWYDYLSEQLSQMTLSDISAEAYVANDSIYIPVSVRYALDQDRLNLGLFTVIVEDKVVQAYQRNGYYLRSDEVLGPWGVGGEYGKAAVLNVPVDDVCRAVVGSSYNGSTGAFPSSVESGKEYTVNLRASASSSVTNWDNARAVVVLMDANNGLVINAVSVPFKQGLPSAIASVQSDDTLSAPVEYFSVNGVRLSAPQRGINIIRQGNSVRKVFVK